jgi:D-alanyl-D-alanine dipeptidase
LTGIVDSWDSTHATMRLWRRTSSGWEPLGDPWPAVVGRAGVAWEASTPEARQGPRKHEGDHKSPAGAFALRHVYGYAVAPPAGTKLPYTPVDASWDCVDDPASTHYAQVLDHRSVAPDWGSFEHMHRDDAAYTWVIDTEFNRASTVASAGSCIFLHVWSGESSSTEGCTAMAEPDLAHLISVLEPGASYVLLPRGEYDALRAPWGLPAQ